MQTIKIIKISEGVFKHILTEDTGAQYVFYNTKNTEISIDVDHFSITSANRTRSIDVENIRVFQTNEDNEIDFSTLDELVVVLVDLQYPPLFEAQNNSGGISQIPFTGVIHVDGNLGNDETGNGNINAPYETFQKALDVAENGNLILLAKFDYTGNFVANCDVIIRPLGKVEIFGTITSEYDFSIEGINVICEVAGSPINLVGNGNTSQIIDCDLFSSVDSGTPALVVTGSGGSLYVKGGTLRTAKGSEGNGYLRINSDTLITLDNVDTDLGDDNVNYGIIVSENCNLRILAGTKIDGQYYNPDGGTVEVFAGATLMKVPSSATAMIIGTANTFHVATIYPGVICNSSSVPAFVGDGVLRTSGGIIFPIDYNRLGAFESTLEVTSIPTTPLQLASNLKIVTDSYNVTKQDATIIFQGTDPDSSVNMLASSGNQGAIVNILNDSPNPLYVPGLAEGVFGLLMPNESASYQATDEGSWKKIGGFSPLKLAKTWWVAKNGNDDGTGNITSPFLTIQKAHDVASLGDRIVVCSGEYVENFTSNKILTIQGFGGIVTINGNTIYGTDANTGDPAAVFENLNFTCSSGKTFESNNFDLTNLIIRNCTIKNSDPAGAQALSFVNYVSSSSLELQNVKLDLDYGADGQGYLNLEGSFACIIDGVKTGIADGIEILGLNRNTTGSFYINNSDLKGTFFNQGSNSDTKISNSKIYAGSALALYNNNCGGTIKSDNTIWGDPSVPDGYTIQLDGTTCVLEQNGGKIYGNTSFFNDCYGKLFKTQIKTLATNPIAVSSTVNRSETINCVFDTISADFAVEAIVYGALHLDANSVFTNQALPFHPDLNGGSGVNIAPMAKIGVSEIPLTSSLKNGLFEFHDNILFFTKNNERKPFVFDRFVTGEIPVGTIDGINTTFTLSNTPMLNSEVVYLDTVVQPHVRLIRGIHYTILGAEINFLVAPIIDSTPLVDYRW
jgi:hypothetical protein